MKTSLKLIDKSNLLFGIRLFVGIFQRFFSTIIDDLLRSQNGAANEDSTRANRAGSVESSQICAWKERKETGKEKGAPVDEPHVIGSGIRRMRNYIYIPYPK